MGGITIWFKGAGLVLFRNTTDAYYQEYKHYPRVSDELPAWLTKNGWPCAAAKDLHPMVMCGKIQPTECSGLYFANKEDATAFILQWY